eukprot:COSAG06_NODE_6015_length_3153_cov_17.373281_3_plen_321_part_01
MNCVSTDNELFPLLDDRLASLGLVGPLASKVQDFVYNQVEDTIRKLVNNQLIIAYDNLNRSLQGVMPGCGVQQEKGSGKGGPFVDAQEEDEYGWVVKEGGWEKESKRRRNAGDGPGSPMAVANQIVSPEIQQKLRSIAGEQDEETSESTAEPQAEAAAIDNAESEPVPEEGTAVEPEPDSGVEVAASNTGDAGETLFDIKVTLQAYLDGALKQKDVWLEEAAAIVEQAGKDPKKLAKIKVPTSEFHVSGLRNALSTLLPLTEHLGGQARNRVVELGLLDEDGIALNPNLDLGAMRRALSQVMQEIVMDKVQQEVYPLLDGA